MMIPRTFAEFAELTAQAKRTMVIQGDSLLSLYRRGHDIMFDLDSDDFPGWELQNELPTTSARILAASLAPSEPARVMLQAMLDRGSHQRGWLYRAIFEFDVAQLLAELPKLEKDVKGDLDVVLQALRKELWFLRAAPRGDFSLTRFIVGGGDRRIFIPAKDKLSFFALNWLYILQSECNPTPKLRTAFFYEDAWLMRELPAYPTTTSAVRMFGGQTVVALEPGEKLEGMSDYVRAAKS